MSGRQGIRDFRLLRGLRRIRRQCWKLLVWFVIGSAVLVSVGRLVAPYADAFRPVVERFLAQELGQLVRIERIEASWPRLSPQITLYGLEVGARDNRLLDVDRARLEFKLYNLVRPGHNSFELIVLGLDLVLVQDSQGGWSWRLDRGGTFAEGWENIISAGDVLLRDAGVRVAPHGVPDLDWSVPEARLSRSADRLRVRLEALPAGGGGELLEVSLELHMPESRLESISGYARSPNLALSHLAFDGATAGAVADLRTQMQWWVEWDRTRGGRFHGRVDLHSLAAGGIAGRMSSRFELDGRWRSNEFRVELNAREFGAGDSVLIDSLAYGYRRGHHALAAGRIELEYLNALMQPWLGFFEYWPSSLEGTATELRLGMDPDGAAYAAEGRVSGLGAVFTQPEITLSRLDARIGLDGDQLRVRPSGAPVIGMPALYPEPIEFDRVSGTIGLRPGRLELAGLRLEHRELAVDAHGRVALDEGAGGGPFVDLMVDLPRLSSAEPRRWLPARGIAPDTRNWLDDALLAVGSLEAVTTLFGDPTTWKSGIADGSVSSRGDFSGLELAYAKDWPAARAVSGTIEFVGESMEATVDAASAAGVSLRAPHIRIADRRNAEIEMTLETVGTGADDLARLARAMPLDGVARGLEPLEWSGPATASARLWYPVKHRDDWRLNGAIDFDGAGMRVRERGISVSGLAGKLPFSRQRMGPGELDARMADESFVLGVDAWFGPQFNLAVSGRFPATGLMPASWKLGMPELVERISGSAAFDITLGPVDTGAGGQEFGMELASGLEGVALDLPMPLAKGAGQRWPFELALPLADGLFPARFELADRFAGQVLMTDDYWQLGLGLGGAAAELPVAENFIVEGRLEALALDEWLGLLVDTAVSGSPIVPEDSASGLSGWLDVEVGDLRVQQTSLGAVELVLTRERDYWRLNGLGRRIEGTVRFPASDAADRAIIVDLQRLHWPAPRRDEQEPRPPRPPSRLDPELLPALDIAVSSLQWGDLDLGEFRLNSHRDDRGLQLEQVSSRGGEFELNGSGEWFSSSNGPRTRMRLRLSTENLGKSLTDAGFDLALKRGQSVIELQGEWPGSPLDLSLQRVDGSLDLVITDGVIPEASPGAGRVLGLVSLNSIPRRLRLDFSDVFGDGLAFDRVAGRFELAGGIAETENMRIDSPAAEVRMRGRTDLKERTYDQVLIVRPGVGSTLPIIGALAGGPVGAAAGVALQQIFSRPLSGISEVRYSVTGGWREPKIEPVRVEGSTRDVDG